MPQIILTESHFIDNFTLQVHVPIKIYHNATKYKIGIKYFKIQILRNIHVLGLCWLNVTFLEGGSRKIYVSSSSVTGNQPFGHAGFLLGSYHNKNDNIKHFFSESPHPQTHGSLNKVNLLNVSIYDENYKIIKAADVHHLAVCLIMVKNHTSPGFMLSLCADVREYGTELNVMRYICRAQLPRGIRINEGASVALTDVYLPKMFERSGGQIRSVIGDHNGGVIHYTLESDIVSPESDIGSELLRSFCLRVGERDYSPPFLLYTKMTPGEHREIIFVMKVHACADLLKLLFQGSLEVNLSIKNAD